MKFGPERKVIDAKATEPLYSDCMRPILLRTHQQMRSLHEPNSVFAHSVAGRRASGMHYTAQPSTVTLRQSGIRCGCI